MRRPKERPASFVRRAWSVASGLLSFDPLRRVESGRRLLAYLLWSLPPEEIAGYLQFAERLPDAALDGASIYADRDAMLDAIPKGGAAAEVGTWRGDFSKRIAATCDPRIFHLIDMDFGPLDETGIRSAFNGALELHRGDSAQRLAALGPGSLDFIYVDADHSYESVTRDLAAAHRALRPGGHLMCNDYTNWCSPSVIPYGVARAVNQLVNREDYSCTGLALHPAGLYDILLRKPDAESLRAKTRDKR